MIRQAEEHKKESDRLQTKCDAAGARRDEILIELQTMKEAHSDCDPMSKKTRQEHEKALTDLKVCGHCPEHR